MNEHQEPIVKAVQDSVLNLLDLLEQSMRTEGRSDLEALNSEIQQIVLKFIAAIVLSDAKYTAGEQAFVRALIDCRDKPGGEISYLNEYAESWKMCAQQIPEFFRVAVEHDKRHKTEFARGMLRELQLIGNNASVSDGVFAATEHQTVQSYLHSLESFLISQPQTNENVGESKADGWTSL